MEMQSCYTVKDLSNLVIKNFRVKYILSRVKKNEVTRQNATKMQQLQEQTGIGSGFGPL